jgi:hypothetical protein|nr:MAG TPA_asm: hypothetical protein [Caudoviricetes sp.]
MEPFRITIEKMTSNALDDIQKACWEEGEKLPQGTQYPYPMLTTDHEGITRVEWFYGLAGIRGGGGG